MMIGDQVCPKCSQIIKEEWFVEIGLPVEDAMAYGNVTFHCPFCGTFLDVDVYMEIKLRVHGLATKVREE